MSQQSLDFGDGVERLYKAVQALVDRHGLQEVAYRMGVPPATLSHALARRNRHRIALDHVPALLALPGGEAVCEAMAALCGLELIAARPVTPEEQLAAVHDVARELLGGELHLGFKRAVARRVVEIRTGRRAAGGGDER